MKLEKAILASITLKADKVSGGAAVFHCDSKEELESVAANLEAILDGIAHRLSDSLYIIVKH
ncbi:hypothetical protein [Halobacillus sp. BBL2006]|uniref:capping complex subunit for YIEGIA n=1 Tax=Halobacillus sp. BBL2006 TaxID=1543706 RepID=UPI0005431E3C|nr:hypothetical protein [Halobacillus sp. BBL2006]KHE67207.1 hypothetical protein LD39_18715 [Halobacillus sp. BBL2006]